MYRVNVAENRFNKARTFTANNERDIHDHLYRHTMIGELSFVTVEQVEDVTEKFIRTTTRAGHSVINRDGTSD